MRGWFTIEADAAVVVYVGMEHLADESHVGWFVGVIFAELELELEETALPWGLLHALDGSCPFEKVVLLRRCDDLVTGLVLDALEIF